MKTVAVVLAPGFEETEAILPVDLFRRAGFHVRVAGLETGHVTGSRQVCVVADLLLYELDEDFDALILPGGMPGAENLSQSPVLVKLVERTLARKALVGAICAAPAVVLGRHGLLKGKKFTCFPGMEGQVEGGIFCRQNVVRDGNLVTSRGVGTAALFAYEVIHSLDSDAKARDVFQKALLPLPGIDEFAS